MSPRRSQSVDRRRRVLVDDSRNEAAPARPRIYRGDSEGPLPRYNFAALQAINAPISRYIPLRPYTLLVWFLTGLIPIMGLLLLNELLPGIAGIVGTKAARAFDLNASGNLMAWLSSVTFGFAIAVMLGTYSVRRFRRDDYRGRFTVWRWAIAAAAFVSIDATVGLRHIFQGLCETLTHSTLWGDGSIWWVGTWAIVLGAMLVRLVLEMSSSRLAVGWAFGAAACYAWAGLGELDLLPIQSPHVARTSELAAVLLGHHFFLFSLVNYAREVVLEAMGLMESPVVRRAKTLAAREAKRAKKQTTSANQTAKANASKSATKSQVKAAPKAETTSTKSTTKAAAKSTKKTRQESSDEARDNVDADRAVKLRTVSPPEEERPTTQRRPSKGAKPRLTVHDEDYDTDYDDEDQPKLSKAERRRLRKEQKRQQRKAA